MNALRSRRGALSEINVTPLVDVVLVLLIIFVITAPALFQELPVNLPKATVGQARVDEGVVVTVAQDGSLRIGNEKVSAADFAVRFAAARARAGGGERPVFVRADDKVPYGKVVEVVGRIREAGVERVGLVVDVVGGERAKR